MGQTELHRFLQRSSKHGKVKVLTMKEPFGRALVRGVKPLENRSWMREDIVGQYVAIHRGDGLPDTPAQAKLAKLYQHVPSAATSSAILGAVRIDSIQVCGPDVIKKYAPHVDLDAKFCWIIGHVIQLTEPWLLSCKGMLGLWDLPEH